MGARGPVRTPTPDLRITGSSALRKPGRSGELEPQPELGHPEKPEWLSEVAGQEWDVVIDALVNSGTLAKHESRVLAMYCAAIEEYLELDAVVRDQASIMDNRLALSARSRARLDVLRHAQELGLTPAARSRVQAIKPPASPNGKARHFVSG